MSSQYNEIENESQTVSIPYYSLKHLKVIYGNEIESILNSINEIKSSSIDYFNSELDEVKNNYDIFHYEIKNNINLLASKMIKSFKLEDNLFGEEDKEKKEMILKMTQEKLVIIKNIFFTHTQILETVKQDLYLLKKFLSLCKNFDKIKSPINNFYEKELENMAKNWLLLKLNFENFDINKAINESNIDQNLKDFVIKTCQCKSLSITIQNPKNYYEEKIPNEEEKKRRLKKEEDINNIVENQNNIIKLKMKNVNEADSYFIKCTSFAKLKGLVLDNISVKNYNFLNMYPYMSKLKIKSCQSLDINCFKNLSTNLRKIYLDKNGFVNYECKIILKEYLLKSQSIRDNLEVLSFASNNIGKLDFTQIILNKEIFRALKEMDFRKNKLTMFHFKKSFFPSLTFINLCDNHFNRERFDEFNDIIILESGNNYLMDKIFREEYYNRLNNIISNDNAFPINYLNFSYLPATMSKIYISELKISPSILGNLKELILSNNKLKCDTLFNFISKIKEPTNLKKLNLNGNEVDDTFFEMYLDNNVANIFPKLRSLSLSSNQIGNNTVEVKYRDDLPIKEVQFTQEIYKMRLMFKFVEINKNLTKMNITKNPISDIYTIVPEEKKNADNNSKYIERDINNNIIINGFFSFLVKIRDELVDNKRSNSKRDSFNIKFDCRSNINRYSENYPYCDKPIIFKQ